MKKDSIKEEYKKKLLDIIEEALPGCKVYLFGSRAKGRHSSGSDIDLALDIGRKIEFKKILRLIGKHDDTNIPLNVDFVDLNSVSEEMRNKILSEGILWKT